jgi:hypothetical protein
MRILREIPDEEQAVVVGPVEVGEIGLVPVDVNVAEHRDSHASRGARLVARISEHVPVA